MNKNIEAPKKESKTERLARFGRNVNVLGALAIGSAAAVLPGPNVVLAGLTTINVAQAGGFELWRRHAKNKNKNKTS